ncbi:multisubunit sodium/proton antiporter, MrpA subunit [Bacteroidales bacterium 6E]|nr:multisubunit sodium/proton antiporter, MrpA subunit [Bacteroidales bacterium 6E]
MQTLLLVYLVSAFFPFLFRRKLLKFIPFFLAFVHLGSFSFFLSKVKWIADGNVLSETVAWVPQLGINFDLVLNGLSLAFALLITGTGVLVFLYAHAYMKSYKNLSVFYFYLFLFSAAMLGLVLSGNLIQLFVFWELTSYLSFLLISFFHEKETARNAAFQSLFLTGFGGLVMLGGILLLGSVIGSYSVSDWVNQSGLLKSHQFYLPGVVLIFVGVFTKSAQFPFHFWLPGAMQAPTPVSSYLHSATMVKAGIFMLALLSPVLGGTPLWTYTLSMTGAITMFLGAYFAITQTDIKAILAYTTISSLGVLVLLLGIDTALSVKAAMLFLYVHAFYKAALFMIAGFIDKKTGTRDWRNLGGLARSMPVTFVFALLASLSMAGLPPMLGFLGKELIYEAKVQSPVIAPYVLVLGVAGNALMITVALFFLYKVFLGKPKNQVEIKVKTDWAYIIGPGLLALLSLFFGLFPAVLGETIIEPALISILERDYNVELKLWHGFNTVFFLSLFTVSLGFILFYVVSRNDSVLEKWRAFNQRIFSVRFVDVFNSILKGFLDFSKRKTELVQHGYHRFYILTIFLVASIFLWYQVYVTIGWNLENIFTLRPFYVSRLVLVIILSTIFSVVSKSRMATIISMGVVGYGIALLFMYYSAIDLAITQIIVETLILVMFVLILQRLPLFARLSSRTSRIRDFFIALSFGSAMTVLALKSINVNFNHPISDYMIENSYTNAFGQNVVNVILVDFRALDTLGEVTVLVVAALGVYVLLKTRKT